MPSSSSASGNPAVTMAPSGGGYETDGCSGTRERHAVNGGAVQDLGLGSGSTKRQAINIPRDLKNLVGNKEDFEVACKDSERIFMEIENLRSQLDEDVKDLGYCEENQKLKVELALKVNEIQCLKKQNEELQAMYECLHMKIVKVLENQIHTKRTHLLQFETLNIMTEFPYAQHEEDERRLHESCDEALDSSSKLVDESLAEKNCVSRRAEKSMQLELEVAKLDAEIQSNMEKFTEMLELTIFSEELGEIFQGNIAKTHQQGLEHVLTGQTAIGIKRMGELDEKPFQSACKNKYGDDDYRSKAAELVSTWQEELKNPTWYPFKVIVQFDEEAKEVIDDDDAKLKLLQITYGDDVCNAVKTALAEINEYNPNGRYVVPEFWNFRKGQKATMKEVRKYLFGQMYMTTKCRRR